MQTTKRAQLKTMLAHALVFDTPFAVSGTMRCGEPSCHYKQRITPSVTIPAVCPGCNQRWRFCTTDYDPNISPDAMADMFTQYIGLSFFVVDGRGEILAYHIAHSQR